VESLRIKDIFFYYPCITKKFQQIGGKSLASKIVGRSDIESFIDILRIINKFRVAIITNIRVKIYIINESDIFYG